MTMLNGWQIEFQSFPSEVTDGNYLGLDAGGASQNPIFGNVVTRSLDTSAAIIESETVLSPAEVTAIATEVWGLAIVDWKATTIGGWITKKLLTVPKFLALK